VLDDVEDALVDCLDASFSPDAETTVQLTNVKKVHIRNKDGKTSSH